MALREIITYPDQRLNQVCQVVEEIDEETKELIRDMAETMYEADAGVGLAAPQVGVNKRIVVCDVDYHTEGQRKLMVLINPEIVEREGEILSNEGCLSCPDTTVEVPRSEWVRLKAMDEEGNPVDIDTDDFLAIVFQHELDHLDGRLIVNHLSSLKRKLYRRKLKKLQDQGESS